MSTQAKSHDGNWPPREHRISEGNGCVHRHDQPGNRYLMKLIIVFLYLYITLTCMKKHVSTTIVKSRSETSISRAGPFRRSMVVDICHSTNNFITESVFFVCGFWFVE